MKRIIHYLAALLLVSGLGYAQENSTNSLSSSSLEDYVDPGAEILGEGAHYQYYDEDGDLRAQLYGGQLRNLGEGKVDVTDVRIDVYEKGVVVMTIYAPQCVMHVEEHGKKNVLLVDSEGDVLIDSDRMTIAGRGFRFSSHSNRFEILSEAKVLVKDSTRNLKGLEL